MFRVMGVATMALAAAIWGCQKTHSHADSDRMEQNSRVDRRADMRAPSTNDRAFLMDATAGGTYEVQAGQLALRKSNDNRVRAIAQRMVDDHTRANNKLMDLSRRKGGEVMPTMTADQQKMMTRLNGLSGREFDQEYLQQQDQAHRETISKFQEQANNGRDADLRAFAAETLPTLQEHHRMIMDRGTGGGMGMER